MSPPLPTMGALAAAPIQEVSKYLAGLSTEEVRAILLSFCIGLWILNAMIGYLNTAQLDQPLPAVIKKLYSKEVLARYETNKK